MCHNYSFLIILYSNYNIQSAMVQYLIKHGADIELKNDQGWTPMMYASFCDNVDVVRLLLSHNANVNTQSVERTTPLYAAAEAGHHQTVSVLLQAEAEPNFGDWDKSPLHRAGMYTTVL